MREELRQIIDDLRAEHDPDWSPTDALCESYNVHIQYMVEHHGIRDSVRFLISKGYPAEKIEQYLLKTFTNPASKMQDWRKYLSVQPPSSIHVEVKVENSFNTTIAAPTPASEELPPPADPEDTDPHRFTHMDVLSLAEKIEKHTAWSVSLRLASEYLKVEAQGPITPTMVAFVGCLWRKNIRTQKEGVEPGAVPFEAATKFFKHGNPLLRQLVSCPTNRQLKACLGVLEAVGFLKRMRQPVTRQQARAENTTSRCATYKLLNEEAWQ